ncbi:hypothetical protein F4680DRAFT_435538 [Xylaria scruposa]|nr:hypothetical protein F4680DRAFT_435538 [Xylaria scruposa]
MKIPMRLVLQSRQSALDVPALAPPNGITSNFDDPPNNNALGYGILSTMLALASLAVFLRIFSRFMATRKLRLEDFLGISSFGLFVTYLACAYHALEFPGFYVHQWNVRLSEIPRLQYWFYIASNAYNAMIGTLKVAILLEWLHLFNPTKERNSFFWTCHIIIWTNVLFYFASAVAINLQCIPRQRIWDPTITIGHCYVDANDLYLAGTIINLISDLAILVTPQRVIWRLNITRNRKLGISFIFAIGVLCCGIATARIATTVTSASIVDATYNLPLLIFLGTSEMLCALLVFCVPSVPLAITTLGVHRLYSHISSLLSTRKILHKSDGHSSIQSSQPSKKKLGDRGKSYQEIDQFSLEPITGRGDYSRSTTHSFH